MRQRQQGQQRHQQEDHLGSAAPANTAAGTIGEDVCVSVRSRAHATGLPRQLRPTTQVHAFRDPCRSTCMLPETHDIVLCCRQEHTYEWHPAPQHTAAGTDRVLYTACSMLAAAGGFPRTISQQCLALTAACTRPQSYLAFGTFWRRPWYPSLFETTPMHGPGVSNTCCRSGW